MTTPSVVTSSSYGVTTTTNHSVTLPGSLVAGNLLLLVYGAAANVFTPTGWTHIGDRNGSGIYLGVLARISDGSETSVTITSGGSNALQAHCYQIGGWHGTIADGVFIGTNATGLSANANPPSMSHTAGAVGTLFVAVSGTSTQNTTVSAFPSGYGNTLGSPGRCFVGAKGATADTEDAGNFTFTISFANWSAFTLAVLSSDAAISTRRHIYLP